MKSYNACLGQVVRDNAEWVLDGTQSVINGIIPAVTMSIAQPAYAFSALGWGMSCASKHALTMLSSIGADAPEESTQHKVSSAFSTASSVCESFQHLSSWSYSKAIPKAVEWVDWAAKGTTNFVFDNILKRDLTKAGAAKVADGLEFAFHAVKQAGEYAFCAAASTTAGLASSAWHKLVGNNKPSEKSLQDLAQDNYQNIDTAREAISKIKNPEVALKLSKHLAKIEDMQSKLLLLESEKELSIAQKQTQSAQEAIKAVAEMNSDDASTTVGDSDSKNDSDFELIE